MRSRMRRWTVTSSALVGSSAMIERGRRATAIGDEHALPHAAGELVRVLPRAQRRVVEADALEQLEHAVRG